MITVIGLGFVGLTTALGFCHFGETVFGVENNRNRRETLQKGRLPFLEKGLDLALASHLNQNFFLQDSETAAQAIEKSAYIFYCVGTPCQEDGSADLSILYHALEETVSHLNKTHPPVLIIKSTVPPGTTEKKIAPFLQAHGVELGKDAFLANNPEFLREGHCWQDFITPDRIVVGAAQREAHLKMNNLYRSFQAPIQSVGWSTAEFIKYLSNTLLATMISYSNEMADAAEAIGNIDIPQAFHILHMDHRWTQGTMSSYVYPGCGYGGYCLPKDTKALQAIARQYGASTPLLNEVIARNEQMPTIIAQKISKHAHPEKTVGILGLSFKPQSNDVRDCASAKVMKELTRMGYRSFTAYDPAATEEFREQYGFNAQYCESLEECCQKSDILVLLTAWPEFRQIRRICDKTVLDYRYFLENNERM